MELSKENITTIATFLYIFIAPICIKYFNFNLDESTFIAFIGFIVAFISARNPNTMKILGNEIEEDVSSDVDSEEITEEDEDDTA